MYVVAVVWEGGGYTIDLLYIMGDYGRERNGTPN